MVALQIAKKWWTGRLGGKRNNKNY